MLTPIPLHVLAINLFHLALLRQSIARFVAVITSSMTLLGLVRSLPLVIAMLACGTAMTLPGINCNKMCLWQVFAAEKKIDRDRPQERPRGAFGQDLPHSLTSPPASSAVTGPLKVGNSKHCLKD